MVNHKRLFRLYREEELTVRPRRGRKQAIGARASMTIPTRPNDRWSRWSLDFIADQLTDGRRFRILAFVDDRIRKRCLVITPAGCCGTANLTLQTRNGDVPLQTGLHVGGK